MAGGNRVGKAVLEFRTDTGTVFVDVQKMKDAMRDFGKSTRSASQETSGLSGSLAGGAKRIAEYAAGFFTAQVALNATRTAVRALGAELNDLVIHGSAVADVSDNFERLTKQANLSGAALLGSLREGTHNTIADFELMKLVNEQLGAGLRLTDKDMRTLATGAFALAQATGGDVKEALDAMSDAMLTGRTRALALLTGKINETKAEDEFAKKLGRTREELTEAGKIEAHRIAILDAVAAATARIGEQTDGLDERVAQAQATWRNFQDELGKTVANSPVMNAAFTAIYEQLQKTFGPNQAEMVRTIGRAIDQGAITFISFGQTAIQVGGTVLKVIAFVVDGLSGLSAQLIDLRRYYLETKRSILDPGHFDKETQRNIDQLRKEADAIDGIGKSAEKVWKGGVLDQGLTSMQRMLDEVRKRMVAASTAANDAATANQQAGAAATSATGAIGQQGDALVETGKDAETFAKKLREFNADIGRGLKTLDEAEFLKEFGPKLADMSREMEKFGVIGEQVPANIRLGFRRLLDIELKQFNEQMSVAALALRGVPHMDTPGFDAEMARQADVANINKQRVDAARTTADTLEAIDFQRAEFGIEQAKRWGAGWRQVADMESALSRARLNADVAAANRAFADRTRDLDESNADEKALYDDLANEHNAKVQEMVEAWQLGEQNKRAELAKTHSVALRLLDDMKAAVLDAYGLLTDSLASSLLGMKTDWSNTWHEMGRIAVSILGELLREYLKTLAKMVAARLAANATMNAAGGVGGGGGGGIKGTVLNAATSLGGKAALGAATGGGFSLAAAPGVDAVGTGIVAGEGAAGVEGGVAAGGGTAGGSFLMNPAFWTNPYTIAAAATAGVLLWGITKKGWFRGGEEGVKTNPARDKFFGQFVAMFGGSPYAAAVKGFQKAHVSASATDASLKALYGAHKYKDFQSAEKRAINLLTIGGLRGIQMFSKGGLVMPGAIVPAVLHGGSRGELVTPMDKLERLVTSLRGAAQVIIHAPVQVAGMLSADNVAEIHRKHLIRLNNEAVIYNHGDARTVLGRELAGAF